MAESHIFAGVAGYIGRPHDAGAVGVFRKSTTENSWKHVLEDHEAYVVYVHPTDPSYVYAGTDDGIWRSTDKGLTFHRANFPETGIQIWSFMILDNNPNIMFAGASPIEIFKSEDKGENWVSLSKPQLVERCSGPFSPRVMRLVQKPGNPEEMYAALEIAGAIKTIDGGKSWSDISDDLVRLSALPHLQSSIVQQETLAEGMLDAHAITISPKQPNEVILALRMGLFKSKDEGKTWEDIDIKKFSPTTYGRDVRVSPHNPNTLYAALSVAAASHEGGVYQSNDCGLTWERFDDVTVNGTIMSIGIHPSDPKQIFIGARYNGEIFGTLDAGKSWKAMPLPSPVKDIYSIACG
ncbi:MAG: hypothetical protein CMM58_12910 [Rhodospirillaceae bacterium]|nr:hypothetical protein [Rhodospirillaceae bacterium]|tara:strand:- start:96 stop:1148 length:1053 start_codon:yes stop_codon:yes gene_type:complete